MKRELSKIFALVAMAFAFGATAAETDYPWTFTDVDRSQRIVEPVESPCTVMTSLLFPFWTEGWSEDGIHKCGVILLFK